MASRRPRENSAHEVSSKEMAELAHRQRGILEARMVAVHEQHDFLAARECESPLDIGLQLLLRLFIGIDYRTRASDPVRKYGDFIGYGWKATEIGRASCRERVSYHV